MNISRFIARRITFQQSQGFTKLIIKIGIVAVASVCQRHDYIYEFI